MREKQRMLLQSWLELPSRLAGIDNIAQMAAQAARLQSLEEKLRGFV